MFVRYRNILKNHIRTIHQQLSAKGIIKPRFEGSTLTSTSFKNLELSNAASQAIVISKPRLFGHCPIKRLKGWLLYFSSHFLDFLAEGWDGGGAAGGGVKALSRMGCGTS